MGWAGDLLYPDNPSRRDEVNSLQSAVQDGNTALINSVNGYNDQFPEVKNVAALNATLMAMKYHTTLARKDIPKPESSKVEQYSDDVASQITDTVAMLGGSLGVISLLKAGWATAKLKLTSSAGEEVAAGEVSDVAAMGGDIAVTSSIAAVEGVEGAAAVATGTTTELGALAEGLAGAEAAEVGAVAVETTTVAAEGAAVGAEVAISAGSIAFAGGLVVLAIGVELIMGAINGAEERSQLEDAEDQLEKSKEKIEKTQGTIDKAQNNLDSTFALAQKRFKLIHADFQELERDIAKFKNRDAIILPRPDYSSPKTIVEAQNYLLNNYAVAIEMIGDFDNLSTGVDGHKPQMPLDDFKDPDVTNIIVTLLATEHNVSPDVMRAYMMWYYDIKTTDAPVTK